MKSVQGREARNNYRRACRIEGGGFVREDDNAAAQFFLLVATVILGTSCRTEATSPSGTTKTPSHHQSSPERASSSSEAAHQAPCLLADKTQDPQDWIRTWSPHFPVERRGALVRVARPGAELPEIEQALAKLNPAHLSFVPCKDSIIIWMPFGICELTEGEQRSFSEMLPSHDILHCFDYDGTSLTTDCLSGRLPPQRCLEYHQPLFEKPGCGGVSLAERQELNELAIKLGHAPPGSRICL